jgi:uncharacterized membrane protein
VSTPADPVAPSAAAPARARGLRSHSPFGDSGFGQTAERFARFFGTPTFILGQTVLVAIWIALNAAAVSLRWDPYPFILLNLAFSTQAAYAAPLILLAQTRQADRDKARADAFDAHREQQAVAARELAAQQTRLLEHSEELAERQAAMANEHREMLLRNTELTERVARLTEELHSTVRPPG